MRQTHTHTDIQTQTTYRHTHLDAYTHTEIHRQAHAQMHTLHREKSGGIMQAGHLASTLVPLQGAAKWVLREPTVMAVGTQSWKGSWMPPAAPDMNPIVIGSWGPKAGSGTNGQLVGSRQRAEYFTILTTSTHAFQLSISPACLVPSFSSPDYLSSACLSQAGLGDAVHTRTFLASKALVKAGFPAHTRWYHLYFYYTVKVPWAHTGCILNMTSGCYR